MEPLTLVKESAAEFSGSFCYDPLRARDINVWESILLPKTRFQPPANMNTISLCINSKEGVLNGNIDSDATPKIYTGRLFIIPSGTTESFSTTEKIHLFNISMRSEFMRRIVQKRNDNTIGTISLSQDFWVDDQILRFLTGTLYHLVIKEKHSQHDLSCPLLMAINLHVLENYNNAAAAIPEILNDNDFAKLNRYLFNNIADPVKCSEAAKTLGINPSRFERLLKARTGRSFAKYFLHQRLEHAYALLQTRTENVSNAALRAGFNDLAYFSRVFRKHFGELPSTVKASHPAE